MYIPPCSRRDKPISPPQKHEPLINPPLHAPEYSLPVHLVLLVLPLVLFPCLPHILALAMLLVRGVFLSLVV